MADQDLAALVAQATPGPWKWWTSNSWKRLSSEAQEGGVICPFVSRDGHPDLTVSEADAKLIAMTPDLAHKVLEQQAALEAQAAEIARLTARAEKAEAALSESQARVVEQDLAIARLRDEVKEQREAKAEAAAMMREAEAERDESQAREAMAFEAAAPIRSLIELIEEGEISGLSWTDEFGLYLLGDEQAPVYCALTLTLEQLGKIGSTNPPADAQAALDARINAAKKEGLQEGAEIARGMNTRGMNNGETAKAIFRAILAKIKETGHE